MKNEIPTSQNSLFDKDLNKESSTEYTTVNGPNQSNKLSPLNNNDLVMTDLVGLNSIFIKYKDYYRKILFQQILFIEAAGSYSTFHLSNKVKLCVSFSLVELNNWLPHIIFLKTHRSYLVNINHIDSFIGNTICINDHRIPISKSHRAAVLKRLNILGQHIL